MHAGSSVCPYFPFLFAYCMSLHSKLNLYLLCCYIFLCTIVVPHWVHSLFGVLFVSLSVCILIALVYFESFCCVCMVLE